MIEQVLALTVVLSAAGGDIYRCVDAQGSVQFGDRPCAQADAEVLKIDSDEPGSEARLRRWLESLSEENAATLHTPAHDEPRARSPADVTRQPARAERPAVERSGLDLTQRPGSRGLFVACSAEFFDCTNGDHAFTDRCVSRIELCSATRSTGCCHTAYVSRYQTLRAAGIGRHAAVRYALLGVQE